VRIDVEPVSECADDRGAMADAVPDGPAGTGAILGPR
jgi:hypothetical protein